MNGKTAPWILGLMGILFLAAASSGGCANPIAPSGGPKDTLPPLLGDASPDDSTLNFAEKRIVFSFNEYVQLDNWRDHVIISPVQKHDPEINAKLRTITIRIKDTLEANTTYSYNFGTAIKDVNEGNIARNLTYVFSTGKYIDSLELTGKVTVAQTGRPDSTMIVMLHTSSDDSALIKKKPRYVARLDSAGHFHFRNLPPGVFYLYALKDNGGQRRYDDGTRQLFAFASKPITIGLHNMPDTLYAFLEKDTSTFKKPTTTTPAAPLSKAEKDKAKEKEKDRRLKFSMNLENGQQDLLDSLSFIFTEPLKKFDSSKIRFTDEAFKDIPRYSLIRDTSNKKITLAYKWPENTMFNLIVDKEFAEDTSGRKIPRTDTLKFRTKKESDYGNLTGAAIGAVRPGQILHTAYRQGFSRQTL